MANPIRHRRLDRSCSCLTLAILLGVTWVGSAQVTDELQQRVGWQAPPAEQVIEEFSRWLDGLDVTPAIRQQIDEIWQHDDEHAGSDGLLAQLIDAAAVVHPEARQLAALCSSPSSPVAVRPVEWLNDESLPNVVKNNFKLAYGRWLAQQAFYDEALVQIQELDAQDVVDPATLLFYQAVAHHRLLHRQECLDSIEVLLQNPQIPRRYAQVARLMEADIRPLKVDSLDEVSRLMEDIQRRLRLGRAGKRVQREEDDVIAKLDKMIDSLEQQQQQQQGGGGGQGSNRSNSPAQDSAPLGGSGPGDVDQRPIGNGSGWGNLPPRRRQEALQQISKDLPSHYREVIEEYFRRLAGDESR